MTVTPYLRGRLRFLLVLGFVTQGISLQVSKCLAEQIKPWFFSSFYWKRLKLHKLTLFISQSWLFDFNATWKIFKELNSKWKRVSFRHFNLWSLLQTNPDSTKIIFWIKKEKQLWKCEISFTNIFFSTWANCFFW